MVSEAYEAGVRARLAGKPASACPYGEDSEQREDWLEGHDPTAPDLDADESEPD